MSNMQVELVRQITKIHIEKDALSAVLLFISVIAALIISNNDWSLSYYRSFINYKFTLGIAPFALDKTTLKFVNDGLMAIFFFFLGLEMKFHMTEGEFTDRRSLLLPTITAIGGFVVPAIIYISFNLHSEEGKVGWAIPVATDTAFVLAILSMFGKHISGSTKAFVLGLSIIDDVLAVSVLALFYTPSLNVIQLVLSLIPIGFLTFLNLRKSYNKYLYYFGGIVLWVLVVKSGVHGTIAGVLLAFFIPTSITIEGRKISFLKDIESSIHSSVAFFVLPLFAFVNCELSLKELFANDMVSSITLGSFCGLLIGKPLGVFFSMFIAKSLNIVSLPRGSSALQFLGISCLCGIGFTLSLFIGLLAFDPIELENQMKLGVIAASICSALIGVIIIKISDN